MSSRSLLLAVVVVSAVLCAGAVPRAFSAFAAAQRFLDDEGRAVSLDDVARGRPVAVVVMKGAHCRVCTAELLRLQEHARELVRMGAVVVGVSADAPDAHRALKAELGLSLPLLTDPDARALKELGLFQDDEGIPLPGVLFVDKCGTEAVRVVGRRPGRAQTRLILDTLAELARQRPSCGVI